MLERLIPESNWRIVAANCEVDAKTISIISAEDTPFYACNIDTPQSSSVIRSPSAIYVNINALNRLGNCRFPWSSLKGLHMTSQTCHENCIVQGAEHMQKFGVNVPPGIPVFALGEVVKAAKEMTSPDGEVWRQLFSPDLHTISTIQPGASRYRHTLLKAA